VSVCVAIIRAIIEIVTVIQAVVIRIVIIVVGSCKPPVTTIHIVALMNVTMRHRWLAVSRAYATVAPYACVAAYMVHSNATCCRASAGR